MRISALVAAAAVLLLVGAPAHAQFFLDFEDGVDGAPINDIPGVSFEDFNGFPSLYGDSRTGQYNTTSDDLGYGNGIYHHNGNFFLWAGPEADARGVVVDFTENDGTWFTTGYSALDGTNFYVEAFHTDGTSVEVIGAGNTGTPMAYLTVNADAGKMIDYVVLHNPGNYWLADDMSGDASRVGEPIPEPATLLLLGGGLLGLAARRRRR